MDNMDKSGKKWYENDLLGNIAGVAALAMGALIVTRVVKKQTLAAQIRKDNPAQTYHESIVTAWRWLGYENPFKV